MEYFDPGIESFVNDGSLDKLRRMLDRANQKRSARGKVAGAKRASKSSGNGQNPKTKKTQEETRASPPMSVDEREIEENE